MEIVTEYEIDFKGMEQYIYEECCQAGQAALTKWIEDLDQTICEGRDKKKYRYEKKTKSTAGYAITTTVYECESCKGCPHKARCIKPGGKQPIEERAKRLHVSKTFLRQRAEAEARITGEEGILLRLNRSIQVEGAFGVLKEDMSFRFLLRGHVKVETEFLLLCMAYNVNKLHNKI